MNSKVVLVVDDNETVRTTVGRLLNSIGVEAVLASGGAEAKRLIEESPQVFDAVLLDVVMPGLGGYETARHILDRYPATKIVMCSGHSKASMPLELTDHVGFLRKPYRLKELQEKLAPLLGN